MISVKKLVCYYVHDYEGALPFAGETHDFWEMVYIEEGEAVEVSEGVQYQMKAGDILFHAPNTFHESFNPKGGHVIDHDVSFQCRSRAMEFFKGYKGTLSPASQRIARMLFEEGKRSFQPYKTPKGERTMIPVKDAPVGGQQMYRIYLEALLINILREQTAEQPVFVSKDEFQKTLYAQIMEYLKENIYGSLSLADLSERFHYGNTVLCTRFKEQAGETIMQSYNRMKIEEACRLMRDPQASLADISARLGFSNPYYFSRVFRRVKGASPSEYRKRQ